MLAKNYRPTAPLSNLIKRAQLLQKIRAYFDSRGFIEVQTPVLSGDTVIDAFVEPLTVSVDLLGKPETFYLQTSPEFAMKRLIASGMTAIYQITPAFRKGDRGNLHNIEFCMLEWYRVGDNYQQGQQFLIDLIEDILNDNEFQTFIGNNLFQAKIPMKSNVPQELTNPKHYIVQKDSFEKVFFDATGINPHIATHKEFHAFADSIHLNYPDSFLNEKSPADENDWIDLIFSDFVQPRLNRKTEESLFSSTLLFDYPVLQSQLAQTREIQMNTNSSQNALLNKKQPDKISENETFMVSERFELFMNGIEIANGYHELRDSEVLRQRNEEILKRRLANGLPLLPSNSRLLAAMDNGFPECCGCALGLDRLLMILLNASSIDDVLTFPIEIA